MLHGFHTIDECMDYISHYLFLDCIELSPEENREAATCISTGTVTPKGNLSIRGLDQTVTAIDWILREEERIERLKSEMQHNTEMAGRVLLTLFLSDVKRVKNKGQLCLSRESKCSIQLFFSEEQWPSVLTVACKSCVLILNSYRSGSTSGILNVLVQQIVLPDCRFFDRYKRMESTEWYQVLAGCEGFKSHFEAFEGICLDSSVCSLGSRMKTKFNEFSSWQKTFLLQADGVLQDSSLKKKERKRTEVQKALSNTQAKPGPSQTPATSAEKSAALIKEEKTVNASVESDNATDGMVCPICLEIFNSEFMKPIFLTCCGNNICEKCIPRAKSKLRNCPMCRDSDSLSKPSQINRGMLKLLEERKRLFQK